MEARGMEEPVTLASTSRPAGRGTSGDLATTSASATSDAGRQEFRVCRRASGDSSDHNACVSVEKAEAEFAELQRELSGLSRAESAAGASHRRRAASEKDLE